MIAIIQNDMQQLKSKKENFKLKYTVSLLYDLAGTYMSDISGLGG